MKFRKKGPIEVKVQSKQGETFTFQFDLIDFVPIVPMKIFVIVIPTQEI